MVCKHVLAVSSAGGLAWQSCCGSTDLSTIIMCTSNFLCMLPSLILLTKLAQQPCFVQHRFAGFYSMLVAAMCIDVTSLWQMHFNIQAPVTRSKSTLKCWFIEAQATLTKDFICEQHESVYAFMQTDRPLLHGILLDSLQQGTVKWDHHMTSIKPISHGSGHMVRFSHGDSMAADVVIGAGA